MTTEQMAQKTQLFGYFHAMSGRKYCNPFENIPDNTESLNAYREGYKTGKKDMMKVEPAKDFPDWYVDNYVDACGNCYSDADPGL